MAIKDEAGNIIPQAELSEHINQYFYTIGTNLAAKHEIPIPKTNNPNHVSHLRPISILPLRGKILEHLIHRQLMFHLSYNKILSPNQYGFRPASYTVDAKATLIDDVGLNHNNNNLALSIFIDFAKAFYTSNHLIIFKQLTKINLHSSAVKRFLSYLSNRSQTVLTHNNYSTEIPKTKGVPQGSVLGTLLFIILLTLFLI